MNWYPFGIPTKLIKKGPRGPPGNGFKLTEDGHYDMENKNLKNCQDPIDDQDVSTKKFVIDELDINYQSLLEKMDFNKKNIDDSFDDFIKATGEQIHNLQTIITKEMNEHYLYSHDGHVFDAKDQRIGNVKDPIDDKNVTNKRYVDKSNIVVSGNDFDQLHNILFDPVKSYYFEDNLKLKFDMTMILTLFFEVEELNDRVNVDFETLKSPYYKGFHTDQRLTCTSTPQLGFYSCSVVLKGEIGDILKIHTHNIKNPFLKIQIL